MDKMILVFGLVSTVVLFNFLVFIVVAFLRRRRRP